MNQNIRTSEQLSVETFCNSRVLNFDCFTFQTGCFQPLWDDCMKSLKSFVDVRIASTVILMMKTHHTILTASVIQYTAL